MAFTLAAVIPYQSAVCMRVMLTSVHLQACTIPLQSSVCTFAQALHGWGRRALIKLALHRKFALQEALLWGHIAVMWMPKLSLGFLLSELWLCVSTGKQTWKQREGGLRSGCMASMALTQTPHGRTCCRPWRICIPMCTKGDTIPIAASSMRRDR